MKHDIQLSPFKLEIPEYYNFAYDVIDRRGLEERTRLAMIWVSDRGGNRKLTFWDFMVNSNRLANFLKSIGLRKGDRVLLMMPRIPEWWYSALGAMKLGVVFLPTAVSISAREIAFRCNTAGVKAVITDAPNAEKIDQVRDDLATVTEFIALGGPRPLWRDFWSEVGPSSRHCVWLGKPPRTRASDPVVLYFTSGTTGEPKMVLHDQTYALAHRVTAQRWHGLDSNSVHWTVTDTGWGKLAWGAFFGQWIQGSAVFVYDYQGKVNPQRILTLLEEYGVTSFCAPPTLYRMLILEDLGKYNLSDLRQCTSAGEPLNPEVIEEWKRGTGLEIREGYGQTETVVLIANLPGEPLKYGSMGKAVDPFDVCILNERNEPAADDEEGVIAVRVKPSWPPGLFRGYHRDEKLTRQSFQGDWYLTGDRARRDRDGYFWFIGRSDDVFKSSGYRISPFEVESALIEHDAVAECAVIGAPDEIRGLIVKAFVILAPGFTPSPALIRSLQDHVRTVKAPYMYPREVEFVEELPKTVSGKIRRGQLREQEIRRIQASNPAKG